MTRLIFVGILLLSASASAQTVKIAAWNLGGLFQIPQTKLDNIIEGLELLDADIVAIPETNPLSHAQTIATELSQNTGECYDHRIPDQPTANQQIGFVFKCIVDVAADGMIMGSDLDRSRYRNAAYIQAKADIHHPGLIASTCGLIYANFKVLWARPL